MSKWRTLALVGVLVGSMAACAPKQDQGGGGGGPQPVASDRLPRSNEVNPSPKPDSYIDERARQQGEHKKGR